MTTLTIPPNVVHDMWLECRKRLEEGTKLSAITFTESDGVIGYSFL